MAPYQSDGSLTTDKRVIDDSDGWASQAEWEAYQSASDVEIVDGSVRLAELTVDTYTFDDDAVGTAAPGPWSAVDASGCQVDDTQSNSSPHSYLVGDDLGGGGARYIQTTFGGDQFTSELSHFYYENESESGQSAIEFATSDGETLLYVGTSSPQFVVDAATGNVMLDNPNANVWNQVTVTFDWTVSPPDVTVEFSEVGSGSSETNTYTVKSTATADLGEIAITHGGTSSTWGGGGNEVYYDDIDHPL